LVKSTNKSTQQCAHLSAARAFYRSSKGMLRFSKPLVPPQKSFDRHEIQTASVMAANTASAQDLSSRAGHTAPSLPQGHTAILSTPKPPIPPQSNADWNEMQAWSRVRTIWARPRAETARQRSLLGILRFSVHESR
jgi:hypothetical protein